MKKFQFSLESVFEYKKTVEKKQKDDLSRAENHLRALRQEEAELTESFRRNSDALEELLSRNESILTQLPKYDAYFRFLRDEQEALKKRIIKAEAEKKRLMDLLIGTMKEIKVYEKLREEQYNRYLEEVAREDAKNISDLVSYQSISGQQN